MFRKRKAKSAATSASATGGAGAEPELTSDNLASDADLSIKTRPRASTGVSTTEMSTQALSSEPSAKRQRLETDSSGQGNEGDITGTLLSSTSINLRESSSDSAVPV